MSLRAADESTEVLLADYIEGRLSPEQSREIDAYLQKHPRERQVIEQLKSQHALVGGLPRESAPPDVVESIQSRLERSALLESLSEIESPRTGAVRSRPQRLALAAVLVGAVGLASFVYLMLAPPGAVGGGATGGVGGGVAANSVTGAVTGPTDHSGEVALAPAGPKLVPGVVTGSEPVAMALRARSAPAVGATTDEAGGAVTDRRAEQKEADTVAAAAVPGGRPVPRAGVVGVGAGGADEVGGAGVALGLPEAMHAVAGPSTRPGELAMGVAGGAALDVASKPPVPVETASVETPSLGDDLPTRRLVVVASDVPAAKTRIEAFLKAGGWAYVATPAPSGAMRLASVASLPGADASPAGQSVAAEAAPNAEASSLMLVRVELEQSDALLASLSSLGNWNATGPAGWTAHGRGHAAGKVPARQGGGMPVGNIIIELRPDVARAAQSMAEPLAKPETDPGSPTSRPATRPVTDPATGAGHEQ